MNRTAYTEPQCLYNGALYVYLYLYSPYGPYGLYRASVPVQRYTLPLPIPLLPLWTVQPLQILSACTTLHFTFTYTSTPPMGRTACTEPQCLYNVALYLYLCLYYPYGPYGLYRASVPVQRCTLPLHLPLLPLWAVQPQQSLSACTKLHFTFIIIPMGINPNIFIVQRGPLWEKRHEASGQLGPVTLASCERFLTYSFATAVTKPNTVIRDIFCRIEHYIKQQILTR